MIKLDKYEFIAKLAMILNNEHRQVIIQILSECKKIDLDKLYDSYFALTNEFGISRGCLKIHLKILIDFDFVNKTYAEDDDCEVYSLNHKLYASYIKIVDKAFSVYSDFMLKKEEAETDQSEL